MADASSSTIETKLRDGRCLRAAFRRVGHVYEHCVEVVQPDNAAVLLHVAAPDVGSDWPSSPPWQELHEHELPSGATVLMLVGRAGFSHWSMAVSVDEAESAIVFDVACRFRLPPAFLGTTYRVLTQGATLQAIAVDGATPVVETTDNSVLVYPSTAVQPPATIRWKYSIRLAE